MLNQNRGAGLAKSAPDVRKKQLGYALSSIPHEHTSSSMDGVGTLLNYLTEHKAALASNEPKAVADCDIFVRELVKDISADSPVRSILEVHGWNGKEFIHSTGIDAMFYPSITAALSTLVLKQQVNNVSCACISKR